MQREIVKPQYGTPLFAKLDFGPEGIEKPSSLTGEMQYMYTIDDDERLMFLPATARHAIMRSGAQAGDTIALTKIKRGGQTTFTAELVSDTAEPADGIDYQEAEEPENPEYEPTAPPQRVVPKRGAPSRLPQRTYYQPENGHRPSASRHAEPRQEMPRSAPEPTGMSLAVRSNPFSNSIAVAIAAVKEFNTRAEAEGLALRFGAEDARALLISHYIGAQRNGGRS